ncbi:uncharacterized protein LOC109622851 isoform X1 [Aedes albopictus]|uniref:Secreted protein n=1 Tax=Aedes albopictus TaxID=7160 RepID=A0ABM1ZI36_AEDAL
MFSKLIYLFILRLQMREILENNSKFRRVVYSKLDANIVPSHKELLMMVRVVCKNAVEKLVNHHVYPTFEEKKELAIRIIDTFPLLKNTKVAENAPDYSYFFWKNGGKNPGVEHTGLIQSHLRNACKNILPENKKFVHKRKLNTVTNVSPETIEKAQAIGCVDPVPVNFHAIMKGMAEAHDLLLMLLREKKRVHDILSIFPHFKTFNGVMVSIYLRICILMFVNAIQNSQIQKAYERMNPNYNKSSHIKQFLSRGLMLEDDNFNGVHDDHLRGCLRIFLVLGQRGTSKTIGIESLPVEEQLVAPLVRWIPKHDTSLAEQLAKYVGINLVQKVQPHIITDGEHYYIYLQGEILDCGKSSLQAIDVFFKSFCVFGVAVPAAVRKVIELFEVVAYKTKSNGSTQGVNHLAVKFSKSLSAEASDTDSD